MEPRPPGRQLRCRPLRSLSLCQGSPSGLDVCNSAGGATVRPAVGSIQARCRPFTSMGTVPEARAVRTVPGVPCKSARFGCGFGWDCAIAPVNGHSACGCTAATAQSRAGHTICNANRSSRCRSCYKISPDAAPGTCLAAKGARPSRKKRAPALLKMHL